MRTDHSAGTDPIGAEHVELSTLEFGLSPRSSPPDPAYVQLLAEVVEQLPPILVHRPTRTVIDGAHRVAAHRAAGRRMIAVRWFDGPWEEAYAAAVEANVAHGLPLSLAERRCAAVTLLGHFPDRADRWIAHACGLSHTTIGKLRSQPTDEPGSSPIARVGRDGRRRHVPTGRHPSPHDDRTITEIRVADGTPKGPFDGGHGRLAGPAMSIDHALRATTELTAFSTWLASTRISDGDWEAVIPMLPLGRLYQLADDARRRAASWARLATALEQHARTTARGTPQ